jgi:hypothetical protein
MGREVFIFPHFLDFFFLLLMSFSGEEYVPVVGVEFRLAFASALPSFSLIYSIHRPPLSLLLLLLHGHGFFMAARAY